MSDVDAIEAGRDAWATIHHATSFEAWRAVALAVAIGRQHALREAGANKPFGKKYAAAINRWLENNGFREMPFGIRSSCCILADNIAAIDAWRTSLPSAEQGRQNNPQVILRNWRRATGQRSRPRAVPTATPKIKNRYHAPVRFSQDMVRRAAMAMRENFSNDVYALARICLMAAIPHEGCLADLLPAAPPPKPAPRQIAAPVALELA